MALPEPPIETAASEEMPESAAVANPQEEDAIVGPLETAAVEAPVVSRPAHGLVTYWCAKERLQVDMHTT